MAKDITIRKHPVYVARCAQVLRNRLAIDGGRPYVDERLQRAPNETDVSWLGSADDGVVGRRERACLVNDAGRIAAKINQYLFKSPVTRNGADERWLDNVTGDGKSAAQFMEDVSTAITAAGWCWPQCDRNPQEFDEFGNPKPYTLAMRVYNDLLVEDMAAATKSDLVRVSRGGDPNCDGCGAWEGVILSVAGKTEGFPTYDEAKAAGCFHPNCVHTLEPVDETADADDPAREDANVVHFRIAAEAGAVSRIEPTTVQSSNSGEVPTWTCRVRMDVVFICDPDYSAGAGGVIGGGSGTSTGDGGSTGGDEPTPDIPEE